MEIKTKHKKFKSFTDLYSFMVDGHLEEISVTMKYPDGTKSNGIMPIDMVLSFKCIEDIKSLDKELATKHNEDINKVREIAETYNEMNHFDDEEGELQSQLENIESSNELKQIIQQLVNERLQA